MDATALRLWGDLLHSMTPGVTLTQEFLTLTGQARPQGNGWQNTVAPWRGEPRLTPARNAQGLKYWRYATGFELTHWLKAGHTGWGRGSQPVVALGSVYANSAVPVAHFPDRNIQLRTVSLGTDRLRTPGERLKELIAAAQHDFYVLCMVPLN